MKIKQFLDSFDASFLQNDIEKDIQTILHKSYKKLFTAKHLQNIFSCIDLTSLNVFDTEDHIKKLVKKINGFKTQFPDYKPVAGLCVFPNFLEVVKNNLNSSGVKIISVAACFPTSQTFFAIKEQECKKAILSGAEEIDVVINVGEVKLGRYEKVFDELKKLREVCANVCLKVILETGELRPCEIYYAAISALYAGADFIKTSTGKAAVNATLPAAYIMCRALKDFQGKTKAKRGFKAAGGISSTETAVQYYALVEHILGDEWLQNNYFRIGASGLCNKLLTTLNQLEGKEAPINYF